MNILISIQAFDELPYVDHIKILSKDNNISNIYIVSSAMHELEKDIKIKYESIDKVIMVYLNNIMFNKLSGVKFVLPSEFIEKQEYMFSDVWSSYRWLPISLRYDNDTITFSTKFYYDIYNFFEIFFSSNHISSVILLNEEHSSLDSIMIRTAKKYNVKNILVSKIVGSSAEIGNFYAIYNSITEEYILLNSYLKKSSKENLSLEHDFSAHSEEYKMTFSKKIRFLFSRVKLELNKEKKKSAILLSIFLKTYNLVKTSFMLKRNYRYIKMLRKFYSKISVSNINIEKPYIYYCLHFDPEAATLPVDNSYFNQLLNIRIILSALPDGWSLYIKEHPDQLNEKKHRNILINQLHSIDNFRSKNFYKYIAGLKDTFLVGMENDHKKLIKNAKFVVSNTGTVFRESNYMKKQCMTFSKHTFYKNLEHVNYINDVESCKKIIETKQDCTIIRPDVNDLYKNYTYTVKAKDNMSSKLLKLIVDNKLYLDLVQ